MMDYMSVIGSAKKRLAELEEERSHLFGLIQHAEALAVASRGEATPHSVDPVKGVRKRKRQAPAMAPTREAARKILDEYGEPIETRNLLSLIRERGVDVGGKDPVATLSARLSNSREFRNKRGVGWWFSDRPYPSELGFEEAEDETVEGSSSASSEHSNNGGSSNAAALS